jgi:hypothetical protein
MGQGRNGMRRMEVVGWIGRLGKKVEIDGQRILSAVKLEGASGGMMGRTGNGTGLLEGEAGQTQGLMTLGLGLGLGLGLVLGLGWALSLQVWCFPGNCVIGCGGLRDPCRSRASTCNARSAAGASGCWRYYWSCCCRLRIRCQCFRCRCWRLGRRSRLGVLCRGRKRAAK